MSRTYTPSEIASTFSALLATHLVDPAAPAFYVWARRDRAIVSVNPGNIKNIDSVYHDRFRHHLATVLGGVTVTKTNSRGLYFQIGYTPSPPQRLDSRELDLNQQPEPLAVPVGQTRRGELWINVREMIGALIAGTTGFGKTTLEHAWIRALIHGKACKLLIWDGKRNSEFSQYAGQPGCQVLGEQELGQALCELRGQIAARLERFAEMGVADLDGYNRLGIDKLQPIVLVIDEARRVAEQYPEAVADLVEITATGRAAGVVSIIATQRTSSEEILSKIKVNLPTRICFAVPANQDSRVVLDRSGAEKIAKVPGRCLVLWRAALVEAQAYRVGRAEFAAPDLPVGHDWQLMLRANAETEARVSIPILRSWGISEYRARVLLDQWQSRGWVEGGGQGFSRRLTPRVLEAISQSLKVPQSDLKVSK